MAHQMPCATGVLGLQASKLWCHGSVSWWRQHSVRWLQQWTGSSSSSRRVARVMATVVPELSVVMCQLRAAAYIFFVLRRKAIEAGLNNCAAEQGRACLPQCVAV